MVIDNLAPQTASLSGATASFTAPSGLAANTHSVNFNYSGDSNYAAQNLAATLVVKQAPLVATAQPASRAFGAANPTFSGTLTGGASTSITGSSVSPNSVGTYNALITATSPANVQTLTIPVTLTQ